MKKLFTLLMLGAGMLSAHAQYQLANAGFEEWESVAYSGRIGDEPQKWSSFLDGEGGLKSMAGYNQLEKSTDKRPGSEGTYSAKLTSRAVKMGLITLAVAQGNLTNGCINMGSTTATDAKGNYNFINSAREDQSMKFSGRPDAVKVWLKFKGATTANVNIVLTTDGYYQDPEANEITATVIAKATNTTIASNDTWTEFTIPFVYTGNDRPTQCLASFSTCAVPGKGKEADYMFVDDVVIIYNSELKTATYDGAEISFSGTSATVDALYDESKLALTSNGVGATIEKSYDEATAVLTITVKGDNISEDPTNKHVYTIQFKKLVTVSVSFNTKYDYITFCAPFDTQTPHSGYVDSYTVDGLEDNGATLVLKHVTGSGEILPAHTPVLLQNSYYETATHELRGIPTEGTPKAGLLTGTYEDIKAPKGSYVLQYQNETLGFYKVENTQPTVKAYHAYLNVDSNVKGFGFSTENGATAIKALEALTNGKPEIYDLNGRKLNKLQKGVNIVNGVKVLVK